MPRAVTETAAPPDAEAATESAPEASARPRPSRHRRERERPDNGTYIFSERMLLLIALLVLTGMLGNDQLNRWVSRTFGPKNPTVTYDFTEGKRIEVDLTVVTADSKRLMCASDRELGGDHCAFQGDKRKAWPRPEGAPLDDNHLHVIQPYRTAANNTLVLVSGLWAQPEIATRVHREPPDLLPAKRQARFTARCQVTVLGKLDEVWVRWEPGKAWGKETNAPVVRAESCTIDPPRAPE